MKLLIITLLIACTSALASCADDLPTRAVAVDASASNRVVEGTSGGGQALLPPGFTDLDFAFNANGRADGSATGQFRYRYASANGSTDFHGEVTCMAVDPVNNRAWIGGVVTQNNSTNPASQRDIQQPGRDVWFRVVDNGEGEDATADRTTVLGFEGGGGIITSAEYCARQIWAANDANTWMVTAGNIQVRH